MNVSTIVALACLAVLAAVAGAAAALAFEALHRSGERARIKVELEPVRTALTDLEERLDQWQKRDIKRQRDELKRGGGQGLDDGEIVDAAARRRAQLAAVRQRFNRGFAAKA